MKKTIIIGGGASGLLAAIFSAKNNCEVTILEKNTRCGKKILSTGNGRCNYWNRDISPKHYRSENLDILEQIISIENQKKILDFFDSIGLEAKIKDGYYYPYSGQAVSVQNALILQAKLLGVNIVNEVTVSNIEKKEKDFIVNTSNGEFYANKVIISTGSNAGLHSKEDEIGLKIAKRFGIKYKEPLPALVQLVSENTILKRWAGIRTEAKLSLYIDNKKQVEEMGEIQLTNYGISGICTFQLSGRVSRAIYENKKVHINIDFLPWLNEDFISFMDNRSVNIKNRNIGELLDSLVNYKLISSLIGADMKNYWNEQSIKDKARLANLFKSFKLDVIGTKSFENAQVASGGILLDEIDYKTMELKRVKDLCITGELLDADGDCGGYNLAWAWITGMLAGI